MNPRSRQRALRSLLGALLQSDLSVREMRDLADELKFGSLGNHLGELILDIARYSDNETQKEIEPRAKERDDRSSQFWAILDLVARRRLSKKQIIQMMDIASPRIKLHNINSNKTTKELIENFLSITSEIEKENFLNLIQGEPADAYLKGITSRNRIK